VEEQLGRSFDADLSAVRVHTGSPDQTAAQGMAARAFTVGSHIFLGPGERPTDTRLMAHELAHVVQQQGHAAGPQRWSLDGGGHDAGEREAHSAAATAASGGTVSIHQQVSSPRPQRLGISDALDFFADAANNIPGFAMLTFVLGFNPINMRAVARNATNLFRAIIGFLPGGNLIFQALQTHGIIDRVGGWVQEQLGALGMAASSLRQALDRFLDSLSWTDIFNLGGVWERAKRIFTEPIDRIISFLGGLVSGILRFIREAILRPVARLAEGTRAYDLLRLVLGQDPITGDPYPRTAENMIGGFMRLIGQEEKWQHLQQSGAIGRVWAWFQQQIATLMGFVRELPQLFSRLWETLQISDLLDIGGAFNRVRNIFGGFVTNFITWAGNAALQIMMFIFEVLAPGAMPVLRRAASVIRTIVSDPIRFVGNLVRAALQGFRQFSTNIRTHLINGLVGWLTGALGGAGLQLPARWDLRGILSLVLQILGLTWQNIRQKLVRAIGETAVRALEIGFDLVVTLVRDGPAAAWQQILQHLQNLQEMVFGQIREWVIRTVVTQAVMRIVSMLNPAGAVIQAIIAIYNTIMFIRERMTQIIQVAEAVFNSLAAIASGAIGAAADYVERTMARLVPVVISFLARLLGLGGISDTIRNIIARIRAPIDRALDRVIDWIVTRGRSLLARVGVGSAPNPAGEQRKREAKAFVEQQLARQQTGRNLQNILNQARSRFQLSRVAIATRGAQIVLQYFASEPEESAATPDPAHSSGSTTAAPAAAPASRLTFSGQADTPTPYGAVRAVYGSHVVITDRWPKVTQTSWIRPGTSTATIQGARPGGDRPSVIGTSGQVGYDEHYAVHGVQQSYDGGHLIGLQLIGNDTNVAANLAPQRGSFNRGTYLQIETMVRESPVGPTPPRPDPSKPIEMSVTVSYPGSGSSVPYNDLKSRGMIAPTAPDLGAVTIPRRVPNRWVIRLRSTTAGYVLTSRTAGRDTQMERQFQNAAADENASFIKTGDRFVWWRTGTPPTTGASVGGSATETIVAEQATP
jgi:hypothetical protein